MSLDAPLSSAEREVLTVLWELGPATAKQIRRELETHGREWAPTTVSTLLARLENKDYVSVDKSDFAHVFQANVNRESVVRQRLKEIADDFCDGKTTPLMLALAKSQQFTDDDVSQFRALLDELQQQAESAKKRPKRKRT